MKPFAFEDLPNILGTLVMRVESIERMVKQIRDNKPPEDFDPGLMTILEASKLVNLSVATIYSKVCRKEMPANKKGKKLYFIRSELLEWIKSGRIKTMSEMQREADQRFNK
ncbi:helix-turn-helix domain-containing protein [Flavobacterium nitrogenifigens]|uniref:helix-turn-helix domain-containing protein n=1 Tax=Flavobacterium nitrogenifigens TaxID=1617283 RepID=UPI000DAE9EAE|nr:helix-turn-helix domain-containing protein [Flavobacterium nitrogenifigens]KAF2337773.1 helix-turn-helix domain-containing protein [Flavobacterium nitrogenifigens]